MRIFLVVFLASFLPACMPLAYVGGMGASLGADILKSGGEATGTKISKDRLAQLKPGMTQQEVSELLQKPPTMVATKGDGSSIATYNYDKKDQGVKMIFSKREMESQIVMVQFDSKGRYMTHTFSERRVCGSQYTGYSAANCEGQTSAK